MRQLHAAALSVGVVVALTAGSPAVAESSPEASETMTARPPQVASGTGAMARVEGVVASVDGVIAQVIPRTASADGALEQEGEADFTLSGDVYFEFGSAVLVPRATADLATVAAQVREAGVTALDIVGHTDTVGSDASNQTLSEQRAASVVAALQQQLPGVTLTAQGRGETELIAAETTEDGQDDLVARALNRRVTITPVA